MRSSWRNSRPREPYEIKPRKSEGSPQKTWLIPRFQTRSAASILRKSKRPQAFAPAAYRAQYQLSTPPRPHPGFRSLNRVQRRVESQNTITTKEQNYCCKAVTDNAHEPI